MASSEVTPAVPPPSSPKESYHGQVVVRELHDSDFETEGRSMLALKPGNDGCFMILFYINTNDDSIKMIKTFTEAAQEAAGVVFAVVDARRESKIASAFVKIKGEGSSPMPWLKNITGYPVILVYRNGWPTAFYNGPTEKSALISYAMKQACSAGFYEQKSEGIVSLPSSAPPPGYGPPLINPSRLSPGYGAPPPGYGRPPSPRR